MSRRKTQDAPVLSASAAGKEEKGKKREERSADRSILFIGVVSCVEVYLLEGVCKFRK